MKKLILGVGLALAAATTLLPGQAMANPDDGECKARAFENRVLIATFDELGGAVDNTPLTETKLMLDRLRSAYSGAIAARDGWNAYIRAGCPVKEPAHVTDGTAAADKAVALLKDRIAKFEVIEQTEAFLKRIDDDQKSEKARTAPTAPPAGTNPAWLEAIKVSDRVSASHVDVTPPTAKQKTPVRISSPHLNANQKKFGCTIEDGAVFCGSPGTGMCWKKGHNPNYGQSAEAISVGNGDIDPKGPDEGHGERCG